LKYRKSSNPKLGRSSFADDFSSFLSGFGNFDGFSQAFGGFMAQN
jgi:hypothetical protein